ncbi:MAG: hypothetical protein H0U71_09795 [Gammaproteobacteria bacterium]|nr:hypothetical protein [Gammaproteobacteria bacterium]
MKLSVSDFITKIELNDFKVYNVDFDVNIREFKVSIEGAYWFKENASNPIVMENGGYITARSYDSFEARCFSPQDRLWRTLDYKNLEIFDEVNEKSFENGILRLAGFGKKSGHWIEYLIKGGEIEVYLKD